MWGFLEEVVYSSYIINDDKPVAKETMMTVMMGKGLLMSPASIVIAQVLFPQESETGQYQSVPAIPNQPSSIRQLYYPPVSLTMG